MVIAFVTIDVERRGFFLMKWATARIASSSFLKLYPLTNQFDQICTIQNLINRMLWNRHNKITVSGRKILLSLRPLYMMQSNGDDFNALKMKKGKSDELALLCNETSLVGSIIIIGLWRDRIWYNTHTRNSLLYWWCGNRRNFMLFRFIQ